MDPDPAPLPRRRHSFR
ncbi:MULTISPECIES: mgtA regulatory leader peptide MgtL [Enterobacteriaceae]|uniref:mgtA leader peptide n=1 Tax=Citrobacter bitternis TaxID=1585982 RepID=A0ABW1PUF8_9ENTR|nr:mgtA regulatory leader peptide MgtL [Phytobacter diazotrophicus]